MAKAKKMAGRKAGVDDKLRAELRRIKQWHATGKTHVERIANAIDRAVPADSAHPDAMRAREYADLARKAEQAGATVKPLKLLLEAQAAAKDFMLFDDAVEGERFRERQRDGGFLRHEQAQAQHEQWRRWQAEEKAADRRFGKYSRTEQARRLKRKHCIPESEGTIRKRLS